MFPNEVPLICWCLDPEGNNEEYVFNTFRENNVWTALADITPFEEIGDKYGDTWTPYEPYEIKQEWTQGAFGICAAKHVTVENRRYYMIWWKKWRGKVSLALSVGLNVLLTKYRAIPS